MSFQKQGYTDLYNQNFNHLRNECLTQGELFSDPKFNMSSETAKWLRPKEIASNPKFFVDGASRFDVNQGELDDCTLLAAIGSLSLNKELFYQVVPIDQGFDDKYVGIFHFRFWQFGQWVDVVIDDRLPTTSEGKLKYLHSVVENEFWSALLEKAYVKINSTDGSCILPNRFITDAMINLTGGVSEMYNLGTKKELPNLLTIMLDSIQQQSLMGASILNEKSPHTVNRGLSINHAYSITSIIDVYTKKGLKITLIRLRNPHGYNKEWNDRWSDKSDEWLSISESEKRSIGLMNNDDGEFWMSYDDFFDHYCTLEICHLAPGSLSKEENGSDGGKKWYLSTVKGEWVPGTTAGGFERLQESFSSNPQYYITFEDPDNTDNKNMCTVIIALMIKEDKKLIDYGFHIYNLNELKGVMLPLDQTFFKSTIPFKIHPIYYTVPREGSLRFSVIPGKYCIVPCTSDQNFKSEFLLRVFSDINNSFQEIDHEVGAIEIGYEIKELPLNKNKIKNSHEKLKKYFLKVTGSASEFDWMDLKDILDYAMKQEFGKTRFSNDVCRCLIVMIDWDRSGKFDFNEFQKLWVDIRHWKAVFDTYDKKKKSYINGFELESALSSAGFHIKTRIINTMCHRYANKKGYIMFDDFIMCAIRLKTTIEIFKKRDPDNTNVASFTLDEWVEKTFYS